jgi:DNA repair exonuclease SbcCD ATPase subunit
MNTQFQATQGALNELVGFARSSTAEQMALGKTQVEELTAVLRQLMVQMNETAGASVSRMAATLTAVVHDLSTKVTQLGEQMTQSMVESASRASGVATAVVEQANNWSTRSAEQLAQLLERHQAHLGRIEDLRGALDATLVEFKEGIQQYAAVTADLRKVSIDANAVTAHAAEATKTMRGVQEAVQHVATLSTTQVEHLAEANRQQEESWRRIQESMRQYQQVFAQVDKTAGELLTQISQHLRDYTATSRQGLEGVVKVSNELIESAVQRLGASINELEEYLEDLTETLGKARVRA